MRIEMFRVKFWFFFFFFFCGTCLVAEENEMKRWD